MRVSSVETELDIANMEDEKRWDIHDCRHDIQPLIFARYLRAT